MNLNIFRPISGTEDLLPSITKNFEMRIKQTHTKPQRTLEIRVTKPREAFFCNPPISKEGSWKRRSIDVEVYNSIF